MVDPYMEIKALFAEAKDQVFEVHFFKKDATIRILRALQGDAAAQHIKGSAHAMQITREINNPNLINLYDVEAEGFRAVNLDTTFEVWIDGKVFDINNLHPVERIAL